jgi:hypothetical protein
MFFIVFIKKIFLKCLFRSLWEQIFKSDFLSKGRHFAQSDHIVAMFLCYFADIQFTDRQIADNKNVDVDQTILTHANLTYPNLN